MQKIRVIKNDQSALLREQNKQLNLQNWHQQEILKTYANQIVAFQGQFMQANKRWLEQAALHEQQLFEKEKQMQLKAEACLLELKALLEEKNKQQEMEMENLKAELNALKKDIDTKSQAVAPSSAQSVPSRESQETTNGPCPTMTSVHQNVIERRNRSLWKTRRTVLRVEMCFNPSANPGARLSCEPYDQLMKEVFPEPQIDTKTDSETLFKGIKDILVQIQHQNERVLNRSNSVKKFGRPKTKAHERLETERENQDPEDWKKYLQDEDFILHNPPSPEIILRAHEGTHQPDPSKLLVDTWGQIHSEWNNQVIGILKERVKDKATLQGLPLCSEAYLLQLVEDRVTKLHVLW
ncbi:hypothetical protein Clacol_009680 [Clathrus columnatus]|uniref:Uncharacterized protein n=1 Tax=Clathrus columnatus TaxID=1419009 RepID=A0AAV5ALA8_9AGAM|nr:hypothetical protein Clacol_009680 [Clathrus columnatus]